MQREGGDELHRAALAANGVMDACAATVAALLTSAGLEPTQIAAIGVHGQTVRHRPDQGYTTQLANPARLAEATGITVVADFRSRDVAAGGQGAPLVPAFHAALFGALDRHRVVVNIGGIANITDLPPNGPVRGFDTGPGNTLLDAWAELHTGKPLDRDGAWAARGNVIATLLGRLQSDSYFALPQPKAPGAIASTCAGYQRKVSACRRSGCAANADGADAQTIADAIIAHCAGATEILVCGGGAHNLTLMRDLATRLLPRTLTTTALLGVPVNEVEALAFAWLARETMAGRPGNLPAVTGARGSRVLGAIYHA